HRHGRYQRTALIRSCFTSPGASPDESPLHSMDHPAAPRSTLRRESAPPSPWATPMNSPDPLLITSPAAPLYGSPLHSKDHPATDASDTAPSSPSSLRDTCVPRSRAGRG